MLNYRHSLAALTAFVMIGTLAFSQSSEFGKKNVSSMLMPVSASTILVTDDTENEEAEAESDRISELVASANLPEDYTEEDIQNLIKEKSEPEKSYVFLTSGTLCVRETPSNESAVKASLDAATEVTILESTDDWYKVLYNETESGYVQKSCITDDKNYADFGAKHYDNYTKGKVVTNGGSVYVRRGPSKNDAVITTLTQNTEVVMLYNDKDYVKVCYNNSYDVGYITADCLEVTGEFVSKSDVSAKQAEVAAKRAAEAEAKKREEQRKASNAAKAVKSAASTKANTPVAPAGSGSGQALVAEAAKYLGTKYVYGGSRPGGFDCSGLVQYCCARLGYSIARVASAQSGYGTTVSLANAKPGDLLFFANSSGYIHHVGIYAGNNQMIHAPSTGDVVKYSPINTSYRMRELCIVKRIFNN